MTYVEMVEDKHGDLVDIRYYCSPFCFEAETGRDAYGSAWPGGVETDYSVYCERCGSLMWSGLEDDDDL